MKIYKFTVLFEREPEGGYVVSVPSLPGCHTEGRTFEEAKEMVIDAIRCYCESLIKHSEPIPQEEYEEQFIGYLAVPVEATA